MPAKSVNQQKFMALVDLYKRKKIKRVSKAVKDAAKSMTKKEIKEFARTSHKGLPKKVKKSKAHLADQELDQLISLANTLDQKGLYKEADMLDDAILELYKMAQSTVTNYRPASTGLTNILTNPSPVRFWDNGRITAREATGRKDRTSGTVGVELYNPSTQVGVGQVLKREEAIKTLKDYIADLEKKDDTDTVAKADLVIIRSCLNKINETEPNTGSPISTDELVFTYNNEVIKINKNTNGEAKFGNRTVKIDPVGLANAIKNYIDLGVIPSGKIGLAKEIMNRLNPASQAAEAGAAGGAEVRGGGSAQPRPTGFPLTLRHRNDNNVTVLQESLIKLLGRNLGTTGPSGNGADGDFGNLTLAAVNEYLKSKGRDAVNQVDQALFNEIKAEAETGSGAGGGGTARVDPTTPTETISGGPKVIFLKNRVDGEELGIIDVDPTSTKRTPLNRRFFYAKKIGGNWTRVKKQDLSQNQIGALQPVLQNLRRQNPVEIGRGGGGRRSRRSGPEVTPAS